MVRDWLAPHKPPSTLLDVAVLGYDYQLVEVDAAAAAQVRLCSVAAWRCTTGSSTFYNPGKKLPAGGLSLSFSTGMADAVLNVPG